MKLIFRTLFLFLLVGLAASATVACSPFGDEVQDPVVDGQEAPSDGAVVESTLVESTVLPEATVLPDGTIATPTAVPVAPQPEVVPDGLEIIWEAYNFIINDYVDQDEVDPAVLAEAAVDAMVEALDDNHSSYVGPETFKLSSQSFDGKFSGIGAQVAQSPDGKRIIIVAPLPNTPAEKAGIRAGDLIMAVNGEDTEGWSVLDGVNKIRGPEGEPVILTVRHVGELYGVDITIVRGTIDQPSVTSRLLDETDFGVAKISIFTAETHQELREAIDDLVAQGVQGVVIDLRQNPGGLLSSTVDIASDFLTDGLVTYELNGRNERREWHVKPNGRFPDLPLVILVDEFSASGSEVLAGALQDHGRAVIIGTTSFGKGTVNLLRELSNGGGVYLVTGRWYTPYGRQLEEEGITPDVVVEFPDSASARDTDFEDVQMSAAVEQLEFQTGLSQHR